MISVITAIGKLDNYIEFIDRYYENIQEQTIFDKMEFVLVYLEWTDKFDKFEKMSNVKLIKEVGNFKSPYNAWNIGIDNSIGDYITNWNVDDYRFPTNCELKYDILTKEKDVDFVYSYCTDSNDINETIENFNWDYDRQKKINWLEEQKNIIGLDDFGNRIPDFVGPS